MAMVAVVIDIGRIRNARHTSQSAADFAALAAGEELASDDGNPRQACRDALAYLVANVDLPTGTTLPCDSMPLGCGPTTTPTWVTDGGTAAPCTVEITYPVPDTEPRGSQHRRPAGRRRRGPDTDSASSWPRPFRPSLPAWSGSPHSTPMPVRWLRATPGALREAPNLWLLDPTGCTALSVQGGSHLTVGTATAPGLHHPGLGRIDLLVQRPHHRCRGVRERGGGHPARRPARPGASRSWP